MLAYKELKIYISIIFIFAVYEIVTQDFSGAMGRWFTLDSSDKRMFFYRTVGSKIPRILPWAQLSLSSFFGGFLGVLRDVKKPFFPQRHGGYQSAISMIWKSFFCALCPQGPWRWPPWCAWIRMGSQVGGPLGGFAVWFNIRRFEVWMIFEGCFRGGEFFLWQTKKHRPTASFHSTGGLEKSYDASQFTDCGMSHVQVGNGGSSIRQTWIIFIHLANDHGEETTNLICSFVSSVIPRMHKKWQVFATFSWLPAKRTGKVTVWSICNPIACHSRWSRHGMLSLAGRLHMMTLEEECLARTSTGRRCKPDVQCLGFNILFELSSF